MRQWRSFNVDKYDSWGIIQACEDYSWQYEDCQTFIMVFCSDLECADLENWTKR